MSHSSEARSPRAVRALIENLEGRVLMSATAAPAEEAAAFTPAAAAPALQVQAAPAETADPRLATRAGNLGGNLQEQTNYGFDHGLNDLVKVATFARVGGGAVRFGPGGLPAHDFVANLWTGSRVPTGRYTAVFNGPRGARLTLTSPGTARVTRLSYNAAAGLHTYAIDVTRANALAVQLTGTGGQVRNLHVWQPGTNLANPSPWSARYLRFLRSLSPHTLRMKDIIKIDKGNVTANWSDRPRPTDATYHRAGVAWEDLIRLCNEVGANIWVCVPAHATDDYVRNLANLLRTTLRPNLHIYVEYSNEVWSTEYEQGRYNLALARAEGSRPGSNLRYDGSNNHYAWADRRYARRSMEIMTIFRQAWTSAGQGNPINGRVRGVLSSQVSRAERYADMLRYLSRVYGAPRNWFYAIGTAPYFGMGQYNDDVILAGGTPGGRNATASQILEGMSGSVRFYENGSFARQLSRGAPYGLRLVMYESGVDTHGFLNIGAKRAATLDPRIIGLIQRYINAFRNQGGDLAMWYTMGARPFNTRFGTWSLTDNLDDLNQPKMQAFRLLRGRPARV